MLLLNAGRPPPVRALLNVRAARIGGLCLGAVRRPTQARVDGSPKSSRLGISELDGCCEVARSTRRRGSICVRPRPVPIPESVSSLYGGDEWINTFHQCRPVIRRTAAAPSSYVPGAPTLVLTLPRLFSQEFEVEGSGPRQKDRETCRQNAERRLE